MNALTAVQNNAVDSGQDYSGFTLTPSAQSPRLLELTFTEQTTKQFLEQVAEWPVQALECIDSLEVRKKPGGHWIIRDLMGLDLVGLASL